MKPFHKEQLGKVRTKIVATVGPASSDPAVIRQMVEAGVDVFRLNFSHGTHEEHTAPPPGDPADCGGDRDPVGGPAGPLRSQDPPGGDPRGHGRLRPRGGVRPGRRAGPSDDPHHLTCTYRSLTDELQVGQTVLFADGTVAMEVVARERDRARLKVTLPGLIRSHQGINVPGGV